MEIKKVYMDLQEGVPSNKGGKTVWKLESEAFKKPIELEIHYDNTELQEFNNKISDIHKILEQKELVIKEQQTQLEKIQEQQERLLNGYLNFMNHVTELADQNGEQNDIINATIKELGNTKTTVEQQSGTILQTTKKLNEIEKLITKVPTIINDKTFVSGHEMVGIADIDIPDGDYLIISKFVVGEHNEYVENKDEILFSKEYVSNGYVPRYQLQGGTELDTPTATIYYTLVFIPF